MKFLTKNLIYKGWSRDKKYRVTDENGNRYLFRVSDISEYDAKKAEFEMMRQVSALGVPMCQPIEFGVCDEGVFSLQSWIDGDDAKEIIPALSDTEQYVYGLEAGRILKKIHSIPAPARKEDWEARFNRKMDYKIQKYNECPLKYENGQAFIDYINENRYLDAILNGDPAYLDINADKDEIRKIEAVSSLQKELCLCEMVSHEFVNCDRSVQRTVFSNGTAVTVNYVTHEYKVERQE